MKRFLKKILPPTWVRGIRKVKAFLKVTMRNWEKFRTEHPEEYAKAHAERVDYS
jgi:hypothetical protein